MPRISKRSDDDSVVSKSSEKVNDKKVTKKQQTKNKKNDSDSEDEKPVVKKQTKVDNKTSTKKTKKENLTLEEQMENEYQIVDHVAHVLLRPDTYVGSMELTSKDMGIYDYEKNKIIITDKKTTRQYGQKIFEILKI